MSLNNSRLVALRNRMPVLAARPNPTAMAAGVANPIAQGQAITSTAMLRINEGVKSFNTIQLTANVSTAIPSTTGINIALILSASNCIGGFSPCACLTKLIIPDKTVSFPTDVTCAFTVPSLIRLPPINLSLAILCTGALSPVMIASFT